jgi:RNA polymerase sigma-54 factor
MIECVNDKGYLSAELEEIALATGYSLEEAEVVLDHLQNCEPNGIGARNLQESLILQLRQPSTFERKLARAIVKTCLDDFIARRVKKISHRFRVLPDVVEAAFAEITSLCPYPGEGFSVTGKWALAGRSVGVLPDIAIYRSEAGWNVDVRGADPNSLKVNSVYEKRLKELARRSGACKDEKRHLFTYVQRAQDFIKSFEQRRETMRRIGQYLVENQNGFVSTGGYQFLQPLTRSQMAKDLSLHESTVSRATMDKFVQIANGEVVPFEVFFKPALRIQKMIEEILQTENPGNPLSDEQIAKILAKKGVVVARRTVNKYRDRTKLLSSRKRRTA